MSERPSFPFFEHRTLAEVWRKEIAHYEYQKAWKAYRGQPKRDENGYRDMDFQPDYTGK